MGPSQTLAADLPGYLNPIPPQIAPVAIPIGWTGIIAGAQVGISNLNVNFQDSFSVDFPGSQATSGRQIGGFLGYNLECDGLVYGIEGAYNKFSSLGTTQSTTIGLTTYSGTVSLNDYATARLRAGYPVGQFLPYAYVGPTVGRFSYTLVRGASADSRGEAFGYGLTTGLGADVLILPNVFLRGEWEYNVFAKIGGIRTSTNTGRVGVGLKF